MQPSVHMISFLCLYRQSLLSSHKVITLYSIQTMITPCSSLVVNFWNTSFHVATLSCPLWPSKLRFIDKLPPPPVIIIHLIVPLMRYHLAVKCKCNTQMATLECKYLLTKICSSEHTLSAIK